MSATHSAARARRRRALAALAGALAFLSTGAFWLASSGIIGVSVTPPAGLSATGKLATFSGFSSPGLVYAPIPGSSQNQTQSPDGYALGQVTFAAGHTPTVSFSWTDPRAAGSGYTQPLSVCSSSGCEGWLNFGLYEPIYENECWVNESSSSGQVVTITDPAINGGQKLCARLDVNATGRLVASSGTYKGEVSVSEHMLGSSLTPGATPPTFSSGGASSNVCTTSIPTSQGSRSWCTPTTGVSASQNVLFLVAQVVISNNVPNNQGQQSPAGTLSFFVNVQ